MHDEPRALTARDDALQHLRSEDGLAGAGRQLYEHASSAGCKRGVRVVDQRPLIVAEDQHRPPL